MKHIKVLAIATAFILTGLTPVHTPADCGSIPFSLPLLRTDLLLVEQQNTGEKNIKFDPLEVTVFEPMQRSIILWNEKEEILLLSTDQRVNQPASVLEVIPLPSRPTVRLGDFETFHKAQKMVVRKRTWAVAHGGMSAQNIELPEEVGRIDFEEKLGAHDITVAEALSSDGFIKFVQNHLKQKYETENAPIRPEFVKIIESYLDDGYKWFVFDRLDLDETFQSRQPIEYRFSSDEVYYPMRISREEKGNTTVQMLVITKQGVSQFHGLPQKSFKMEPVLNLNLKELKSLESSWENFFPEKTPLFLNQMELNGDISSYEQDVLLK